LGEAAVQQAETVMSEYIVNFYVAHSVDDWSPRGSARQQADPRGLGEATLFIDVADYGVLPKRRTISQKSRIFSPNPRERDRGKGANIMTAAQAISGQQSKRF
jgi:hypothetical protein